MSIKGLNRVIGSYCYFYNLKNQCAVLLRTLDTEVVLAPLQLTQVLCLEPKLLRRRTCRAVIKTTTLSGKDISGRTLVRCSRGLEEFLSHQINEATAHFRTSEWQDRRQKQEADGLVSIWVQTGVQW